MDSWASGQGVDQHQRGFRTRRTNRPLASLFIAKLWAVLLHQFRREPKASLDELAAAEALLAEQRLAWLWNPRLLRGGALAAQGTFVESLACIREGLAALKTG